jgi:hypothetical protein
MTEYRHYPATKAERENRETGWDNPRDDERDPQPYNPDMDRYAIGTNAPTQRKGN